jgi:hypothetical protein
MVPVPTAWQRSLFHLFPSYLRVDCLPCWNPPSSIFLPLWKRPKLLSFLNSAGFGTAAGHELSYTFDNNGCHYAEKGTLTDWWMNATVRGFEEQERCFVDLYGGFTIKVIGPFLLLFGR